MTVIELIILVSVDCPQKLPALVKFFGRQVQAVWQLSLRAQQHVLFGDGTRGSHFF
jgi:hypothetical protein